MAKKNIFKSEIFKCITVLFLITVILGGLLAILNDLLYVSEEETLKRAITKIYGTEMSYEIESEKCYELDKCTINKIIKLGDGNKMFNVTGKEGYKGGTVTLWVVITYENDTPTLIKTVVLDGYDKQTRMGDFKQSFYNKYTEVTNDFLTNTGIFGTDSDNGDIQNVITGATWTANAANNAVNGVIRFVWGGK